ncbi:MAG: hypothetical protein KAH32_02845 [Chlamydiia bacterium]|nr:hypothetical protein [Chlamydiia bacterium]
MSNKNILTMKATRCIGVFIRSDDDNDFLLDTKTGAFLLLDLKAEDADMDHLQKFLEGEEDRFFLVPKITEYEKRKIFEEFINYKVNDLEVSERISDTLDTLGYESRAIEILQEYPYEYDKWISFFSEKIRIRVVRWLNKTSQSMKSGFSYVFEEDLTNYISKEELISFKENYITNKQSISGIVKKLHQMSKLYLEDEIVNPKPRRGRPPKGHNSAVKEALFIPDMYICYDAIIRHFVYYDSEINDVGKGSLDLPSDMRAKSPDRAIEQAMQAAAVVLK